MVSLSSKVREPIAYCLLADEVIRISRHGSRATSVPTSPEPEPEADAKADASSDGDIEMVDSDIDVKPKQVRKRKEKKVVPLGKNGIPKRRVIKSRRERDAKNFIGTSRGGASGDEG